MCSRKETNAKLVRGLQRSATVDISDASLLLQTGLCLNDSSARSPNRFFIQIRLGMKWLIGWFADWLIGSLVDWLIGSLAHWLIGWLADWLIGWLPDWPIVCLADWLMGGLAEWPTGGLAGWLISWWRIGCLADWLNGWWAGWLAGWLVGWQAGAGQNAARLDLTKKRWICDNFMKETVTFLEGCLGESGRSPARPDWKFKENCPTHGRPKIWVLRREIQQKRLSWEIKKSSTGENVSIMLVIIIY